MHHQHSAHAPEPGKNPPGGGNQTENQSATINTQLMPRKPGKNPMGTGSEFIDWEKYARPNVFKVNQAS